jgi:D-serine dehydratase
MVHLQDILDPQLDASFKGFPQHSPPLRRSAVAAQQWNVLAGDLPLPLAVVKQAALAHNLAWMQGFARDRGVDMAPHGKTTMSPQLFQRQLAAGAWGLTFATVGQVRTGATAGARRCLIANQVLTDADLQGIQVLQQEFAGLRIAFLVDSLAQLALVQAWYQAKLPATPFDVLLEIGVPGGRTGCRNHADALALAQALHASPAVRLVGIECYEGGTLTGNTEADGLFAQTLMERVAAIALACDSAGWFADAEVLISAGGSAIFDLIASHMRPQLSRPVRALLRSGCYVTHDHGFYRRMVHVVNSRLGCADGLHPAIEVWASVQSCPEPGLAILAVGRRDLSFDMDLPTPIAYAPLGSRAVQQAPADWSISALNDQHAYLRWQDAGSALLRVGDRVALGISHPCTTFDKWRWMPLVDADYQVCDALLTCF